MSIPRYELMNGIHISPAARRRHAAFEATYNHLRLQEERVFSVEELRRLPETDSSYPHHEEWNIRKDTISRFINYLQGKTHWHTALDVGCGNGFFAARIAGLGKKVSGVDISLFELEQAVNAFGHDNPCWYYLDLSTEHPPEKEYDLITFNASAQYFPDLKGTLNRMLQWLSPKGEIHILESPFYRSTEEAEQARQRSHVHFQSLGSSGMANFYHFHLWDELEGFSVSVKGKEAGFLTRLAGGRRSPFPWIVISKSTGQEDSR